MVLNQRLTRAIFLFALFYGIFIYSMDTGSNWMSQKAMCMAMLFMAIAAYYISLFYDITTK